MHGFALRFRQCALRRQHRIVRPDLSNRDQDDRDRDIAREARQFTLTQCCATYGGGQGVPQWAPHYEWSSPAPPRSRCRAVSQRPRSMSPPFRSKVASKSVDLATTSQSEADQKRGRQIRQREERLGKRNATTHGNGQCQDGIACCDGAVHYANAMSSSCGDGCDGGKSGNVVWRPSV